MAYSQRASLMRLPDELLVNIIRQAVPDELAHLDGYVTRGHEANAAYHRHYRNTIVPRHFHHLSSEVFFLDYIHDLQIMYSESSNEAPCIRKLRLDILARYDTHQYAVRDISGLLESFPGLREVEVSFGTNVGNIGYLKDDFLASIEAWGNAKGGRGSQQEWDRKVVRLLWGCEDEGVVFENGKEVYRREGPDYDSGEDKSDSEDESEDEDDELDNGLQGEEEGDSEIGIEEGLEELEFMVHVGTVINGEDWDALDASFAW
ncbi:hypothetical protein LTR56_002902 [Elasticomyces elasticus]|nr:hypothetical protein LTR56_002902 [Elasticomyces elasticus]KAK3665138.1 hypothetical protein LTR22_003945 [Elasticomyces elasticus]KAK4930689.1 hypothetical protein LTR49_002776 [Elasticomyces elasticus]KAK5759912.1 hypothetical protein LTS12_009959 [Elasticomyces elasticus]